VAGHDSFLGDADPFAQPELYSLIATAEGSDASLICFNECCLLIMCRCFLVMFLELRCHVSLDLRNIVTVKLRIIQ